MCIIILNTKEHLTKELLNECWQTNSDGAGIMYAIDGKINIFKELKNFNTFYEYYSTLRKEFKKTKIALHFRIATSGNIDLYNIHPFYVNENLAFMHNGIINILLQKKSKISDTIAFNQKILKQLPQNFLNNHALVELISRYAERSKLLFMNNHGKYWIINEHLGHWDKKGNWYSNYNYCELPFLKQQNITWTHDLLDYEFCQYCGIELLEEREVVNETCYGCMQKFATEIGIF
ncbi:MAG: class II glutamine amidotransferase [Ignavibacteriae bacterium]|nr:class II glutamine amidotransferase [Ignavibacteriota bacterium]